MRTRTLNLAICAIAALVVVGIGTIPTFADSFDIDNWGTQFKTNPLTCSGSTCPGPQTENNILPGTFVGGPVDRTETLQAPGSMGSTMAQTFVSGSPACAGLGAMDGCLVFNNAGGSTGSLTLDYKWQKPLSFGFPNTGIGVLVQNTGSVPFGIELKYWNGSSFQFADSLELAPGPAETYTFDMPKTTTNEIDIIYNYDSVADADGKLCCIQDVPEPSSMLLVVPGVLGVLASVGRKRRVESPDKLESASGAPCRRAMG